MMTSSITAHRLTVSLCLVGAAQSLYYPEKVVKPQANTFVIYQDTFQAPWSWDPMTIRSQFPVSSLRYNDHKYLQGGTPVYENEVVVVVKSDCTQAELAVHGALAVEPSLNEESQVTALDFFLDTNTTTVDANGTLDIDDISFMKPTAFVAKWDYTSYWCEYNDDLTDISQVAKSAISPKTVNTLKTGGSISVYENFSDGIKGKSPRFLLTVAAALTGLFGFFGGSNGRSRRGGQFSFLVTAALVSAAVVMVASSSHENESRELAAETSKVCRVNVEILHDGCRENPFIVTAPAMRVSDVQLENEQSQTVECTTHLTAELTFPNITMIGNNDSKSEQLPQLERDICYRAVEGRPFMDKDGHQIQASTTHYKVVNGWSSSWDGTEQPDNNMQREALGRKWAQRALGEHASVSSFAAFTMLLMANNAPPALIQDSLVAASDEVRHAKVSFETASLFLGLPVEPSPLPPSSHTFEHNLTALAIATAREGCIDETLSALLLALEVDEQVDALESFVTQQERALLKDSMTVIALEEASHSALAWRTIEWVCTVDADACEAVQTTVLSPAHVKGAVQRRLQGQVVASPEKIEQAWGTVYRTLAPYATRKGGIESIPVSPQEKNNDNMPLTTLVPQKIIAGVVGSSKMAQQ